MIWTTVMEDWELSKWRWSLFLACSVLILLNCFLSISFSCTIRGEPGGRSSAFFFLYFLARFLFMEDEKKRVSIGRRRRLHPLAAAHETFSATCRWLWRRLWVVFGSCWSCP